MPTPEILRSAQDDIGRRIWNGMHVIAALYLVSTVIVATATPIERVGDEVPDQDENDGNAKDVDITNACDNDHLGHQPDADQGGDNGSDEAKGQTPADNAFGDETNDSCYNQVNDEIKAKCPDVITNFDGDAIGQDEQRCEHVLFSPLNFIAASLTNRCIQDCLLCIYP